jgi:hypothetical protein
VLWVLGLAVLLATLSYHSYQTSQRGEAARPGPRGLDTGLAARFGALLLCLGLFLAADPELERWLWGVVSVGVIVEMATRRRRSDTAEET